MPEGEGLRGARNDVFKVVAAVQDRIHIETSIVIEVVHRTHSSLPHNIYLVSLARPYERFTFIFLLVSVHLHIDLHYIIGFCSLLLAGEGHLAGAAWKDVHWAGGQGQDRIRGEVEQIGTIETSINITGFHRQSPILLQLDVPFVAIATVRTIYFQYFTFFGSPPRERRM